MYISFVSKRLDFQRFSIQFNISSNCDKTFLFGCTRFAFAFEVHFTGTKACFFSIVSLRRKWIFPPDTIDRCTYVRVWWIKQTRDFYCFLLHIPIEYFLYFIIVHAYIGHIARTHLHLLRVVSTHRAGLPPYLHIK